MIDFTSLIRPRFIGQASRYRQWDGNIKAVQLKELSRLLREARHTAYGREYGFDKMATMSPEEAYQIFRETVPVVSYEAIAPWIMRMVRGEKDILWSGVCRRFAQSSGTSDGRSKYIPVTPTSLSRNHFAGASDVVAHYLRQYPDSRIFSGKAFILGGSFANNVSDLPSHTKVGDLSANLIDAISPLANLYRIPSKKLALLEDWNVKLPALARTAIKHNITNISGVPSWFMAVLKESLRLTGASDIHEIWPNLEVFFHGGISFDPYREEYRKITDPAKMRYLETYNASEGFFAVQSDRSDKAMQLILDRGVYYEFLPLDAADNDIGKQALAPWEVVRGETYALIITACNGLWRYSIGDTVKITSTDPLKIIIAGRTKHYINAFGEELMVHNAEKAISAVCDRHGCSISNFTAAPVYAHDNRKGRHQWVVEWLRAPEDISLFAAELDSELCSVNSDYAAKRTGNLFLDPLELISAPPGTFNRWLASTGKLGGQRKVPRLYNSRQFIDPILATFDYKSQSSK